MTTPFAGILLNLGLGAALGGGLVYSTKVVTSSMERMKGTVEVKGYSEKDLKSDYAQWSVTVIGKKPDLKAAYADVEAGRLMVQEYLKAGAPKDMTSDVGGVTQFENYRINDQGQETRNIDNYEVNQTISITSKDIEGIKNLSLKVSELIGKGINLRTSPPQYFLDREKLEAAKVELLSAATTSAKQRADQFAVHSGTKVGRLVSARQGVFQIAGDNPSDASVDNNNNYSQYDTTSVHKVLKLAVTLSYTTGE